MAMSNICKQCRGVKSLTRIVQEAPGISHPMATSGNRPVKICSCPPTPAKKHDGNLDDLAPHHDYHAHVELQDDYGLCDGSKLVYLYGGHGDCESNTIYLDPKQALSLLAWLEQERSTLEQLARGE